MTGVDDDDDGNADDDADAGADAGAAGDGNGANEVEEALHMMTVRPVMHEAGDTTATDANDCAYCMPMLTDAH